MSRCARPRGQPQCEHQRHGGDRCNDDRHAVCGRTHGSSLRNLPSKAPSKGGRDVYALPLCGRPDGQGDSRFLHLRRRRPHPPRHHDPRCPSRAQPARQQIPDRAPEKQGPPRPADLQGAASRSVGIQGAQFMPRAQTTQDRLHGDLDGPRPPGLGCLDGYGDGGGAFAGTPGRRRMDFGIAGT